MEGVSLFKIYVVFFLLALQWVSVEGRELNTLSGQVLRVIDGDTVKVLSDNNKIRRIRLAGIDAPEISQSGGNESKNALTKILGKRSVNIKVLGKDRYHRTLGIIFVKNEIDVNYLMIKRGHAWAYRKYLNTLPLNKAIEYPKAELMAKAHKSGLWKYRDPISPWEYRKNRRQSP